MIKQMETAPVTSDASAPLLSAEDLEQRLAAAVAAGLHDVVDEAEETTDFTGEREQKRLASRPDVSHLDNAVAELPDGLGLGFLLEPGQRVVIERVATCLVGKPWLDTAEYRIVSVDQVTGQLHLQNDSLRQAAMSNFKTGTAAGYKFLIPGSSTKRKRQKLDKWGKPIAVAPKPAVDPSAKKKGRGRPPGSKNRPKDVIKAEKLARAAERDQKRAARKVKRK